MQRSGTRTLAAVLFTDMVDSTTIAEELGDQRWKALVQAHNRIIRRELKRFGGTEQDTAGDGFFASFREPAPAISCACAAAEAVRELGVEIRAGVHFGECERIGSKFGGITVVVGARIGSLAGAGEVLVSGTAAELSRGAGFGFEDRGMRQLKGVGDEWRVFAATAVDGKPRSELLEPDEARERRQRIAPEAPRRRRALVAAGVALALVAAVAVPEGIRRFDRGLPGLAADVAGSVDPSNGHITTQVTLGDLPNGIASGAGSEWVALEATNQVARIDPKDGSVVDRIQVQAGPSSIAYGGGAVWVTNTLDGTLSKIDPSSGKGRTFGAGVGPMGVALGDGSVWVADIGGGDVTRIDPKTGTIRNEVPVGQGPTGVTFDGSAVWVANSQSGTVMRIDPATDSQTAAVPIGGAPTQIVARNGQVWVSDPASDALTEIDPGGGGSVERITKLENAPQALAFDSDTLWLTTRASAASHQGGTLRAESGQMPTTIDPNADYDGLAYNYLAITNDGLLGFARVGGTSGSVLVPDLATTIPTPADRGTTYTFELRPGIRYSDGTTVEPSDVRPSFERALILGKGPTSYLADLKGADGCSGNGCDLSGGIQADDEAGTVTFHLTRPDPSFLSTLALPFLSIVPGSTPDRQVRAPSIPATGPYSIISFTKDTSGSAPTAEIVLSRNRYFHLWSASAQPDGYPDRIVIRFGVDPDQATTQVEQGRADVLLETPPSNRQRQIDTRYPAQSHPFTQLGLFYVFLNTRVPPFSNLDARRALNYALDRTTMSERVLLGRGGPPSCQALPPNVPGYAPYCPYTLNTSSRGEPNLVKARSSINASGTRGARVTVWAGPIFASTARYVTTVLDRLRYRASTRIIQDPGRYFAYVGDSAHRVQIGLGGWFSDTPSASGMIPPVLTCDSFSHDDPHNPNLSEYCNHALDRQIARAEVLDTIDPSRATALWQEIDRAIVDDGPWVPFSTPAGTTLVSARVGNYQYNPVLGNLLGQMWVSD